MSTQVAMISNLENSTEFLYGFADTSLRFVHTNRLFQKQFGFENKKWKGKPIAEVIRSLQMEKFLQANKDCITNPSQTVSFEIQTISEESEHWFRWEVSAITDDKKRVEGVRLIGTDITKQKKTEQALLQQAILLDNISDVIISADENFLIKSWNMQAEMMFNLRFDKSNTCQHEIAAIEFENDTFENFKQTLKLYESWRGELLVEKKDGTKVYMQSMVNTVKGKTGKPSGYVALCRNITEEKEVKVKLDAEHKKSKIDLAREKQQFESFMENAPVLAWITDSDGVLRYMNSKLKDAFGYSENFLNKKIISLQKIENKAKILFPDPEVIKENKCIEYLYKHEYDKNKFNYYKVFKFPIKDAEGHCLEGGQAQDITEEINTQKALRESHELFEHAGKATRDVIWDWDLKSNKIRRTGGYKTLFGYDTEDLYEPNSFERIHRHDEENILNIIETALRGNHSRWEVEYRYRCADGKYKIVVDQAYIIRNKNGKAVRAIGSMQDVTEERNLQQQILQAEKLKKKEVVTAVIDAQEKERQELSAELHDNVNQILAATTLYLKTAQHQSTPAKDLIDRCLDHVQKAITELRNISHNLTPSELKLNGLKSALHVFAGKLNIPESFDVKLEMQNIDEDKIRPTMKLAVYRIIQEMTTNILKHANAKNVKIILSEQNNNLMLNVSDNGKGFDMMKVKKGLGITNIFNRVENFGGTADVSAFPGKGCMWNIEIPLSQ